MLPDLKAYGTVFDGDWFLIREDGMKSMVDVEKYCRMQMKFSKASYVETLKLARELYDYLGWMVMYRGCAVGDHVVGYVKVVGSLMGVLIRAFERKG
jgi:hypothetical protein